MARDLVRVRRADAPAGRAEALSPALALVEPIEGDVVRQHEVGAVGDAEVRGRDAMRGEHLELLDEARQVHDRPGTDDAERVRVEDPGRDEVELEGAVLVDDGVAGVAAALESDDEVGLLRQIVGDLAFAFVAPLRTDHRGHWHVDGL